MTNTNAIHTDERDSFIGISHAYEIQLRILTQHPLKFTARSQEFDIVSKIAYNNMPSVRCISKKANSVVAALSSCTVDVVKSILFLCWQIGRFSFKIPCRSPPTMNYVTIAAQKSINAIFNRNMH